MFEIKSDPLFVERAFLVGVRKRRAPLSVAEDHIAELAQLVDTMGVPVVASDIAGNRELLGDAGKNALFTPGDSRALAEKLLWFLEHPESARRQAETWRRTAGSEFSAEQTVEKTLELYERLLKAAGGG